MTQLSADPGLLVGVRAPRRCPLAPLLPSCIQLPALPHASVCFLYLAAAFGMLTQMVSVMTVLKWLAG